jgi:hypothetical protein
VCQKCKENVDARAPLRPRGLADLRRSRHASPKLLGHGNDAPEDFADFKRSRAALVKSRIMLTAALRDGPALSAPRTDRVSFSVGRMTPKGTSCACRASPVDLLIAPWVRRLDRRHRIVPTFRLGETGFGHDPKVLANPGRRSSLFPSPPALSCRLSEPWYFRCFHPCSRLAYLLSRDDFRPLRHGPGFSAGVVGPHASLTVVGA